MSDSTQSIDVTSDQAGEQEQQHPPKPSRATLTRDLIIAERLARINDIVVQMKELRKELRTLAGDGSLRNLMENVTCLRCGYDWWPNDPTRRPKCCARCASTAWDKPPTKNSRKPGDPEPAYWRGRRQSRKHPPRPILRARKAELAQKSKDSRSPLEIMLEEIRASGPIAIPPPPDTGLPSPQPLAQDIPSLAPPPDPEWSGSLSAYLRGNVDEPQPETVTSHDPETSIVTEEEVPSDSGYMPRESAPAGDHTEPAEITSVEEVSPEEVGQPRTQAEMEELAKSQEEAWPTTRRDD